jgi:hypothetical protein
VESTIAMQSWQSCSDSQELFVFDTFGMNPACLQAEDFSRRKLRRIPNVNMSGSRGQLEHISASFINVENEREEKLLLSTRKKTLEVALCSILRMAAVNCQARNRGRWTCRFCGPHLSLVLPVACQPLLRTDNLDCHCS